MKDTDMLGEKLTYVESADCMLRNAGEIIRVDLAEVTRCENCVHSSEKEAGSGFYYCELNPATTWKACDFCSKGYKVEEK